MDTGNTNEILTTIIIILNPNWYNIKNYILNKIIKFKIATSIVIKSHIQDPHFGGKLKLSRYKAINKSLLCYHIFNKLNLVSAIVYSEDRQIRGR